MNMPLISIVMPVRNAQPYLAACLESILKQSYTNYELIAIDDHSTDNSLVLLRKYASEFKHIKVLSNEGKGIIDALNMGYQFVSGDFITRMDADDLMPSEKLKLLYQALNKEGANHVSTGLVQYFKEEGELGNGYQKYEAWLNGLTRTSSNFQERYKECVIPSPCWMMAKEDFERIGGFNANTYPEDYDLAFRMYAGGIKVIGLKEVCHLWRDHGARASRNDSNYADNNFLNLKLKYFIQLDYQANKELFLWGAGAKGKYLAKKLLEHKIPFHWVCDNSKKIGKDIYGKILRASPSLEGLAFESHFIIAVANEESQAQIKQNLQSTKAYFFA